MIQFTPYQLADEAISLFIEYRDVHGMSEPGARHAAALEIAQGAAVTDTDLGPDLGDKVMNPSIHITRAVHQLGEAEQWLSLAEQRPAGDETAMACAYALTALGNLLAAIAQRPA